MIACHLRYTIDPHKLAQFEHYARLWMRLIPQHGGSHVAYFMPSEGANNVALASFQFPSLAAYEAYRIASMQDPQCLAAFQYATDTRCIVSYERSFFRPLGEQA